MGLSHAGKGMMMRSGFVADTFHLDDLRAIGDDGRTMRDTDDGLIAAALAEVL